MATVNLGQALIVLGELIQDFKDSGVLMPNGDLTVANLSTDLRAIAAVESTLKAAGLDIPAKADEVLAALPGVVKLFGG